MKIYYIIQSLYMSTLEGERLYWNETKKRWDEWHGSTEYQSEDEAIRAAPTDYGFTIIKCYIKP